MPLLVKQSRSILNFSDCFEKCFSKKIVEDRKFQPETEDRIESHASMQVLGFKIDRHFLNVNKHFEKIELLRFEAKS